MTIRFLLAAICCLTVATAQGALTPYTSQASFLAALTAPGTEDFESFSEVGGVLGGPQADTVTLTFAGLTTTGTVQFEGGGPTAGLNPDAFISNWTTDYGPVSGGQFLNIDNVAVNTLSINFSEPVSAFGFYLIDAGDTGPNGTTNPDDMVITTDAGDVITIATAGNPTGTQQYFGIIDDSGSFSSVTFDQQFLPDLFGLDDLTIEVYEEPVVVDPPSGEPPEEPGNPNPVPEPASFVVWGALLALGFAARRRRI